MARLKIVAHIQAQIEKVGADALH